MEDKKVVLSVQDLNVKFTLRGQILHAIRGISLDVYQGESLAIVGESGSGKSVFVKCAMGLLDANGYIDGGSILYNGMDLTKFQTDKDWLKIRGKEIAMVFQDPMTSLNPLKTIGKQIQEAVELHQGLKGKDAYKAVLEVLSDVGIDDPERRYKQYPHEFSGGMRQRVVIAIAVACRPKILICALDVTIQAQILELIKAMQKKYDLTTIYITHDLGVVANVADRIAVMCAGEIQQIGTPSEIYNAPATRFVADFIGESNILPATAAEVRGDTCVYTTPMGQVLGAAAHVSEGETVYLCVRPEAVCVSAEPVSGFGIQITVTDNICTGNLIKSIGVDADGHELRFSRLAGADGFSCGETLYPYWDSAACTVMRK